jgi:hypothetical protein
LHEEFIQLHDRPVVYQGDHPGIAEKYPVRYFVAIMVVRLEHSEGPVEIDPEFGKFDRYLTGTQGAYEQDPVMLGKQPHDRLLQARVFPFIRTENDDVFPVDHFLVTE